MYNITAAHNEILFDFDEAGFQSSFGKTRVILLGVVQFIYQVSYESSQVSKLVLKFIKLPIFCGSTKLIPNNEIVKQAFNILAGSEPFTTLAENLDTCHHKPIKQDESKICIHSVSTNAVHLM